MTATSNPGTPGLVVTQGDPDGIGPELILRACAEGLLGPGDLVVAREDVLVRAADCGAPWANRGLEAARTLRVSGRVFPASRSAGDRSSQVEALAAGVELVREVPGRALVTAPIDKAACQAAGFEHPGHTEFLAASAGVDTFAMALVGPRLRVALVTIHEPLARVPALVTAPRVEAVGRLLATALQDQFGIARPRLGVLGLNPHAGEGGMLGREELDVIGPAVEDLRAWGATRGVEVQGPLPADTAFPRHGAGDLDGLVAMYHDQGLGPFKLMHFHDGVNLTLGLPYVRTSPDHGTAADLAGTGRADPSSFSAAIELARTLSAARGSDLAR